MIPLDPNTAPPVNRFFRFGKFDFWKWDGSTMVHISYGGTKPSIYHTPEDLLSAMDVTETFTDESQPQ